MDICSTSKSTHQIVERKNMSGSLNFCSKQTVLLISWMATQVRIWKTLILLIPFFVLGVNSSRDTRPNVTPSGGMTATSREIWRSSTRGTVKWSQNCMSKARLSRCITLLMNLWSSTTRCHLWNKEWCCSKRSNLSWIPTLLKMRSPKWRSRRKN